MKNSFLIFLVLLAFSSCNSVKKYNSLVNQPIAVEKLKKDVDIAYLKLQKLQPALYWYVSKEQMDYKFDSLKTTITKPLTSLEFYYKITPVLNEIRQGHLGVYPNTKQLTKKESKELAKKGMGPFTQFDFMVFDNKLYVEKNKSIDSTIAIGSEVVRIDGVSTSELLSKYKKLITSDGFNTTFHKYMLSKKFSAFYTQENGIKDSLQYTFKFNDSLKNVVIKRKALGTNKPIKKDSIIQKLTKAEKKAQKVALKNKRYYNTTHGFDPITKTYQRELQFIEKDSSVAVLKIKSFSIGKFEPFYLEAFKKMNTNKTKTLVLDLRNNPGGRLREIYFLHSFLADSAFAFVDKSEVASKTSMLKRPYFGGGIAIDAVKAIGYPFFASYTYFRVKKEDQKYYYATKENKVKPVSNDGFKGKIYVLINGGSFSASSVLSSNLKGSKRAIFVGEETGGAFNGTVAGQMPIVELPNSKVKMRVGLMKIAAFYKTDEDGFGIKPDVEIIPTLEDKIKGNDPEMDWILNDLKKMGLNE